VNVRTGDLVVFLKPVAVAAAVVRRDGRVQAAGHPADHARLGLAEERLDALLIGLRAEAEKIRARLATFLRETLGPELNQDKTLITHARTQRARFLGYDISVWHCDTKLTGGQRTANGKIALRVPPDVVRTQCAHYREHGKPWHRSRLQNLDDYDIVRVFGAEYRGVVNYYLLAQDVWRFGTMEWNAVTSMLKTLAARHNSTVTKMAARHQAKVITSDGPRSCRRLAGRVQEGKPSPDRGAGHLGRHDGTGPGEKEPGRLRVHGRRVRRPACILAVAYPVIQGILKLAHRSRLALDEPSQNHHPRHPGYPAGEDRQPPVSGHKARSEAVRGLRRRSHNLGLCTFPRTSPLISTRSRHSSARQGRLT